MSFMHPRKLLSLYLDDELTSEQKKRIDQHMIGCERCADLLGRLVRVRQELQAIPQPALPHYFVTTILARHRQAQKAPSFWSAFEFVPRLLQPAALLLILLMAALFSMSNGDESVQDQAAKTYASVYENSATYSALATDEEALRFALTEQPESLPGDQK